MVGNFCPFIAPPAAGGYFSAAHYSAPRCARRQRMKIYFCAITAIQIRAVARAISVLDIFKHLMTNSRVMMIDFYCHLQRGHAPSPARVIHAINQITCVIMTARSLKISHLTSLYWKIAFAPLLSSKVAFPSFLDY